MSFLSDLIREKTRPFCTMVVVAAGCSARMGEDKLWLELGGMPVLARTLRMLDRCESVHEIIVVTRSERIVDVARLCKDYKILKATKILCGGETRTESALAGVSEAASEAKFIGIHDAARPLVTGEIIEQAVHMAVLHKAAAPAVPAKDTVKLTAGMVVQETPDRENVWAVQTPQVFEANLIKGALTNAVRNELKVTDDCSAAELLGVRVRLFPGSEENIKLTTPLDMVLAGAILKDREMRQ